MGGPLRMRRGTFLLAAAGLGVSLAWRSVGSFAFLERTPSRGERLAAFLQQDEGARSVGQAYLRTVPAEASPELLAKRIGERLPGGPAVVDTASDRRLRALLVRASAEDFHHLRTVELQGWVLARTEARLCALAALLERPATA